MAVQFTLADGFFNRRRGRPPKNRYVQVYKNLQLPPQAVFTSFKLEKPNSGTLTSSRAEVQENGRGESILQSRAEYPNCREKSENLKDFKKCFVRETPKNITELDLQQRTVIRSTGIYFPDDISKVESLENRNTLGTNQDLPEDLSACARNREPVNSNAQFTYSYLQMLQVLNMYQRILFLQSNAGTAEDAVPHDFSKYRFNEDCGHRICRYRYSQTTHFHCARYDCQYSFCEKSRFAQHRAKHDRLDRLLGTDFKRYRSQIDCGYASCAVSKISSKKPLLHYHCLQCSFICRETYRFHPHRRWHRKLEILQKIGFRKVHHNENCELGDDNSMTQRIVCAYMGKRTHYHCLTCGGSVISKSQILGHKHNLEVNPQMDGLNFSNK